MLINRVRELYDKKYDLNCAECIMYAANEEYKMNLSKDTLKVMSSFGGGMAIGSTCGAATGAIAVIGIMFTNKRGHESPIVRELTAEFFNKFYDELGSLNCFELIPKYKKNDDSRCIVMMEVATKCLEDIIEREKR